MNINYFKPESPDCLLKKYQAIRMPDPFRDADYSPVQDAIMGAICRNLEEYAPEAFERAWTSSLFPERLTKEVLRLFEKQLEILGIELPNN